jgi:hypothetical protein
MGLQSNAERMEIGSRRASRSCFRDVSNRYVMLLPEPVRKKLQQLDPWSHPC